MDETKTPNKFENSFIGECAKSCGSRGTRGLFWSAKLVDHSLGSFSRVIL